MSWAPPPIVKVDTLERVGSYSSIVGREWLLSVFNAFYRHASHSSRENRSSANHRTTNIIGCALMICPRGTSFDAHTHCSIGLPNRHCVSTVISSRAKMRCNTLIAVVLLGFAGLGSARLTLIPQESKLELFLCTVLLLVSR